MIGSIEEILDNEVIINLNIDITAQPNLINYHVVFDENTERKVVAQIVNTNKKQMKVVIVGEINNDVFTPGTSIKPSFKSQIRLIDMKELDDVNNKKLKEVLKKSTKEVYDILNKEATKNDPTGVLNLTIKNNMINWSDGNEL